MAKDGWDGENKTNTSESEEEWGRAEEFEDDDWF